MKFFPTYVKATAVYGFTRSLYDCHRLRCEKKMKLENTLVTEQLGYALLTAAIMPVALPFSIFADIAHLECHLRKIDKPQWLARK